MPGSRDRYLDVLQLYCTCDGRYISALRSNRKEQAGNSVWIYAYTVHVYLDDTDN